MLNNEKIILMTKLSLYEQKNQKKEIKTSKYFRDDYMSLKMLKSFLCITVAYLLCLVLWFMYKSDKVISSLTTTGRLTALIVMLVILYIVSVVLYMIFSYAFFSHKFRNIRKHLKEYNGDLKTQMVESRAPYIYVKSYCSIAEMISQFRWHSCSVGYLQKP